MLDFMLIHDVTVIQDEQVAVFCSSFAVFFFVLLEPQPSLDCCYIFSLRSTVSHDSLASTLSSLGQLGRQHL